MNDPKRAIIKDFRLCMTTWIVLEFICFVLIPFLGATLKNSGIYVFSDVSKWVIPSLIFGIFGSLIIAFSTGAVVEARNLDQEQQRMLHLWSARALSLVGFLGVAYPLALTVFNFIRVLQTSQPEA